MFPKLASEIISYVGANRLIGIWTNNLPKLYDEGNRGNELCHGLSSALKAFNSWNAHEDLYECRRSMGGNGFSYHALIGWIIYNGDVNQTFEGDNNILCQQTGKFLMKALKHDFETCEFLKRESIAQAAIDNEGLIALIHQRAKDKTLAVAKILEKDPELWDDI